MNLMTEFLNEYGLTIMYTLVTAFFGFLGMSIKKLIQEYINDKTKKKIAKEAVLAVEQMFKDIHGEEKLEKASMYLVDGLQEKGLTISELELRRLIESAMAEFNKAFEKDI